MKRVCLATLLILGFSQTNAAARSEMSDEASGFRLSGIRTAAATEALAFWACEGHVERAKEALGHQPELQAARRLKETQGTALFLIAGCPGTGADDDERRSELARLLLRAGAEAGEPGLMGFPGPKDQPPLAPGFKGADVPMSPVVAAAYNRRPQLLALLLENGAGADESDGLRDGSALHWAAEGGCTKCVTTLVNYGADIERRNIMGLTPLFVAVARGDAAVVQALLAAGASPFSKESSGRSILEAATDERVYELVAAARLRTMVTVALWLAAIGIATGVGVVLLRRHERVEPRVA